MNYRLPLGLLAMIALCPAIGAATKLVPVDGPAWGSVGVGISYGIAAFVGGTIARRGFVLAAALVALVAGAGTAVILIAIGGDPWVVLSHPLLLGNVAIVLLGAIAGAWTGQHFAALRSASAHT